MNSNRAVRPWEPFSLLAEIFYNKMFQMTWDEIFSIVDIIYARPLIHYVCSYVCLLRSKYTQRAKAPVVVIHSVFLCGDFPIWPPLFAAAALLFQDSVSFCFVLFPLRFLTTLGKMNGHVDGVAQRESERTPSEQAITVIRFSDFTRAPVRVLSCLQAVKNPRKGRTQCSPLVGQVPCQQRCCAVLSCCYSG